MPVRLTGRWCWGGPGPAVGSVVLFGEVVEADVVEGGFGDAFGAVDEGGDGGLADEAGEAADPAGGAFVEVGGEMGKGAGLVVA